MGKISRSYSDKYPENEIIKTTPNTGERVERGDSVDVVISKALKRLKCQMSLVYLRRKPCRN